MEPLTWIPALPHPGAAVLGALLGWWASRWLVRAAERFSYDDETFDPTRGRREKERWTLAELEDTSRLPWIEQVPFLGVFVGMLACCRFGLFAAPDRCADCGREEPDRERRPILSFLARGGRCRHCHAPWPGSRLWIEVVTPLLFLVVLGVHGLGVKGLALLVPVAAGLVASVVDLEHMIIPDEVPTVGIGLGLGVAAAGTVADLLGGAALPATLDGLLSWHALFGELRLGWALAGALAGSLALWWLQVVGGFLAGTEAMGTGDIKLIFMLGLFLGPLGSLTALLYAAFVGCFVGIGVKLIGGGIREGSYTKFAFGPAIAVGALFVLLVGADAAWGGFLGLGERVGLVLLRWSGQEPLYL